MILEGLVTTLDSAGAMHLAPMGPRVEPDMRRFTLRPFPSSQTYRNLRRHPEGVLHVTDDVLLLARGAIGQIDAMPPARSAIEVIGSILDDACRAYEFRVASVDDSEQRVRMECDVVHVHRQRDFFGFNRAMHAVVEAAILATRVQLIPVVDILAEYSKLDVIVGKTGGERERAAFELLREFVAKGPS